MVRGTTISIYPTPGADGETIAYDYYSKDWISLSDGSGNAEVFANDNDTARIDEELLTLGLKWRFLQSKGFPFEAEYREYEDYIESALEDNGGGRGVEYGNPLHGKAGHRARYRFWASLIGN